MTESELGWTAGIIDGEGTVTISPRQRTDRNCRFYGFQVRVTVSNTDIKMIEKLQGLWGGSFRKCSKDKRLNRAQAYRWEVTAQNALNVLNSVLGALVTKQQQAKLAIELQERISNQIGLIDGQRRKGVSQEEIKVRESLFSSMKILNIKPGIRQYAV